MNGSIPSPRWRRRAEARPHEVLEAAQALFVERGYAATNLEQVAKRAGIAKATLYLYYANKLELFKAVVRNSLVAGFDEVAQRQAASEQHARERLAEVMRAFLSRIAQTSLSGIPKLVIAEAGNFPEIARFYHEEVVQRGRALIVSILEQGMERGEFRRVDVDYAWRIVIAPLLLAIIWKHSFQPFEETPVDFEHHLEVHLDLLFNGLVAADQVED